jgi:hypothetical protein
LPNDNPVQHTYDNPARKIRFGDYQGIPEKHGASKPASRG